MCKTCEHIRTLPLDKALAIIEAEIKSPGGRRPEHFKRLLDALLDTELKEPDEAMDEAWERSQRGS
jgi:hypothetical protein